MLEKGEYIVRKWGWMGMVLALALVLGGCGSKADISVFMMSTTTVPSELTEALKTELSQKLEGQFTVDVFASPMYNLQKLFVEYAAGDNGVHVVPEEDVKSMSKQGGHIPLDAYFDKDKYEEGYFDGMVLEKAEKGYIEHQEKHLYALPAEKLPLLNKLGIKEKGLFVAVPVRTPNEERSIQILKLMEEAK
ncbi:hypothetical protein FLT15_04950 [Paenibacillus thiaminolyticus]|nr:hypothetical protein [Paenibacillus thiaminolyticus]NGP57762.1 hypothetical protein [Paenibacillus thiaminolyticus]